ncbi:Tyrosine recombinase XerC [Sulfitobacter indolifex]|uniref:Phage integrase n=1 Tax=Sulfitobacter indolifex HEL-45 TaxID=391624 RepID=A0ABP2DAZ0_9RHOB|nr:tyrosine-type recombinase/integrase [Sulfitobacter indolifex]EDQ04482.1 Phage integrase [Sulfitobacter indolifex HEL-45]UOA19322.1 Tyrosine recombinase XerC [Sulfitobacter indolifex]
MAPSKKVRYLKIDRGRFFYQRRVPQKLHDLLDQKIWLRPCGDVPYSKAIQLVVTWAEEHDEFIAQMASLEARQVYARRQRLDVQEAFENAMGSEAADTPMYDLPLPFEELSTSSSADAAPDWRWAKFSLRELDAERDGDRPTRHMRTQLLARLHREAVSNGPSMPMEFPPFQAFKELLHRYSDAPNISSVSLGHKLPDPMGTEEYVEEMQKIHAAAFGAASPAPPTDPDERDEYDLIKLKLERRISELTPDPHTLTAVSEAYFTFNGIRPFTQAKYRRDIGRLAALVGDIPVKGVTTAHLKQLRDHLAPTMKAASLHAVFTPIKGLFKYAAQEEILDVNPASALVLPRDKRSIEERKRKKFDPEEACRIDEAISAVWGNPVYGLSDKRREALSQVVRALMFTGMRPIEILRLQPHDVEDHLIRVTDSKTESSTRIVPLHPELKSFPKWVREGGLSTFASVTSDPVGPVRHNFSRLIRTKLSPPILDDRKTLYSLRTTFVNAMRRAGADIQMRRAILGHKEAGAIRHYDDGPEFREKLEIIAKTDPRKPY